MITNSQILKLLEKQRDNLFERLSNTSISKLYKKEYSELKAGRVFVFDDGEKQMLSELKELSKDTSFDEAYASKLKAYTSLDNEKLIAYFQSELERVFDEIQHSGKKDEIQAIFIEYDFYYHFNGSFICYGKQDYPLIEEPRYISGEYDYTKQVLIIIKGINFEPAWVSCEEFDEHDYLDISAELESLFKLHSRVLIHKALDHIITANPGFWKNRPFTFYINEHDCEEMMLYRLS